MSFMVFNMLAILTMITFVLVVLLIGVQYKLLSKKTNAGTNNDTRAYNTSDSIAELVSHCTNNDGLTKGKKCLKQLRDFSGGTFGI